MLLKNDTHADYSHKQHPKSFTCDEKSQKLSNLEDHEQIMKPAKDSHAKRRADTFDEVKDVFYSPPFKEDGTDGCASSFNKEH